MTKLTQDRLLEESTVRKTLTAYGSADSTAQGFTQGGLFEPYRYNFNDEAFATFDRPVELGNVPFEVTIDAWVVGERQYILDSNTGLDYMYVDTTGVTLGINGTQQTWSNWSALDGSQLTLRFVRNGTDVLLQYKVAGSANYIDHPDGSLLLNDSTLSISTVGSLGGELRYQMRNSWDNQAESTATLNWRGNGAGISFTTSSLQVGNSWSGLIGRTGSGNGQDRYTNVSVRQQGANIEVRLGYREVQERCVWSFPIGTVDFTRPVVWEIFREAGGLLATLRIDNNLISTETLFDPSTASYDMRINQVGDAEWSNASGMSGVMYDLYVTQPSGDTSYYPMNDGTQNLVDANGFSGDLVIQNWGSHSDKWQLERKSFEGHVFELFMGNLHWTMGSPIEFAEKRDYFEQDSGIGSANDLTVDAAGFDVADWVDLGNASTIYHTENDIGVGGNSPAFVMNDNSPTQFPFLSTVFTQEENDNFGSDGGLVRAVHRYSSLAPIGETNGSIKQSWDLEWDGDIAFYNLDGINDSIQKPSPLTLAGQIQVEWSVNLGQSPTLGDDQPCIASSEGTRESFIGFIPEDLGSGQLYQFVMRNQGGYSGGANSTTRTDLDQGHYSCVFTHPNLGASSPALAGHLTITNVDTGAIVYDQMCDSNTQGSFAGFNQIGYANAKASSPTRFESWCRGTVYGVTIFNNGDLVNPVVDIPIREGTQHNGIVYDASGGQDWVISNYDPDNWYYVDRWQGIFIETITTGANEVTTRLHHDGGVKDFVTTGYTGTDYVEYVFGYDPINGILGFFIDQTYIPELSGTEFRLTSSTVFNDNSLQTACGDVPATGTEKRVQLFELISYDGPAETILTTGDFQLNSIYHGTGLRDTTLIVPNDVNISAGATVSWETEYPTNVTVRRASDESFVLVNLTGEDQVHEDSDAGAIICGNVDSVEGYAAFFTNSLKSGTITI